MKKNQELPPLRSKAIFLLSKKDYFSKELKRKLLDKVYVEGEIFSLIEDFTKRGFLNDERLARRYTESLQRRGYGVKVARMRLLLKAGSDFDIEFEENEEELVALIEKKYQKDLPEKKDKVIRALLRRGFSYDLIKKQLN